MLGIDPGCYARVANVPNAKPSLCSEGGGEGDGWRERERKGQREKSESERKQSEKAKRRIQ